VITKPCAEYMRLDLPTPTMFEDNPLEPSPFVFDSNDFSTFSDFDIFSNIIPSSSSSNRPSPAIPSIVEPQSDLDNNLWFNFSNIHDDIFNSKSTTSQPITGSPMDFLTFANDSPDSGSASSSSGGLSPAFAIDPQLMATPATSKAPSDFGDDDVVKDEQGLEEDEDEDEEGPVTPPPVRHPNKGKDRRSVVHSGGIQKKVHISSVVKTDSFDNTMDDWRPTPDEYQKLTSREKRQLRNKISARNFRNRRKGGYPILLDSFQELKLFYIYDRIYQRA
jgi:bZIP-type transcription factor MBZ1